MSLLLQFLCFFLLSSLSVYHSIFICIFIMLPVTYKTFKCCADTVIMASWQATLVMITIMLIVWFYAVFITYTRGLLCFTQIEVLSGEQHKTICLSFFLFFSLHSLSLFLKLRNTLISHLFTFFLSHLHSFFFCLCLSLSSFCLTLTISFYRSSMRPLPLQSLSVSVFWFVACGSIR